MLSNGTFVLGGAASGKSEWAESLLISSGLNPVYLATGKIEDSETFSRVAVHQARRDSRWITIEEPSDLTDPLARLQQGQGVLIDCATMWLSNQIMQETALDTAEKRLMDALAHCPVPWIIVSNEVGHGIVPENALARKFRNAQGRLNIALAAQADLAVQVIAGIPMVLKGHLP